MDGVSKSKHVVELAKDIIDDIELGKTDAQAILLKCTRLARYTDNEDIKRWIKAELQGYDVIDKVPDSYITKAGRWTNFEERKAYLMPLAQMESSIDALKDKIKMLRIPDSNGTHGMAIVAGIKTELSQATNTVATFGGVKSKVISMLHDFATTVYYERIFDNLAESIFDTYKKEIDTLIAESAGDVIEQIPSIVARLSDNDKESISQALTTCRRVIDSFANYVFPSSDETITIDGNEMSLKADKTLNRINTFVNQNSTSSSRKTKIRQNLKNLYERVSAGVHSDVDAQEARNLFFNTYLILGEILTLKK